MKRSIVLAAACAAFLPLAGCADGFGLGMGATYPADYAYGAYPYDGWYDGYYGSIYDGYWGNDGYFYYRLNKGERNYRRGEAAHFRRQHQGQADGYHEMRGTLRYEQGLTMPSFPKSDDHGRRDSRGQDHRDSHHPDKRGH